jgi:hypothetical protein
MREGRAVEFRALRSTSWSKPFPSRPLAAIQGPQGSRPTNDLIVSDSSVGSRASTHS